MAGIEHGNVTKQEFMEEVAQYEFTTVTVYFSKTTTKNSWEKIGEKFNLPCLFMNIFRIQNRCFLRF